MSSINLAVNSRPRQTPVPYIQPVALTIPEAVAYTRRSRATLYKLINEGSIEARKAGRRTLLMVASLDEMLASLPSLDKLPKK